MLKRRYSTVLSLKNVAVLTEDGAFALPFRPHPRESAIQGKKNAIARGSAERGGELTVAKCRLFSISQTVS